MPKSEVLFALAGSLLAAAAWLPAQPSPFDHLPKHIRRLTWFGERASFSPDGRRIAFMAKTYGDAFEVESLSGAVRCLTCRFRHPGFLRVQFLPNGDYFLIGPPEYRPKDISRGVEAEMWVLKADLSGLPTRLSHRIHEGVAISRQALRISWTNTWRNYPDEIPKGASRLYTADIVYQNGVPRLSNKQLILESPGPECTMESQDFFHNDTELTYTCYQPRGKADVMSVNLATGQVTNHTSSPDVYDEVEGIFPNGRYTTVECDTSTGKGSGYIDIWKLRLDGAGKDYTRLTYFTDTPGYKASNPVISPDGKWMAFQEAHSKDDAGVGYGIFLYRLHK